MGAVGTASASLRASSTRSSGVSRFTNPTVRARQKKASRSSGKSDSKALSITRPREGGGTITVNREGRVIERNAQGKVVLRRTISKDQARGIVSRQKKMIKSEVEAQKAQTFTPPTEPTNISSQQFTPQPAVEQLEIPQDSFRGRLPADRGFLRFLQAFRGRTPPAHLHQRAQRLEDPHRSGRLLLVGDSATSLLVLCFT